MATPFPFQSGQTLLASQLNAITTLPINDQTASYVALVGDVGKRIVMNVATANTVTVNDSVFTTGDTIFVANKGAGASTLTAGAGVTINSASGLVLVAHQSGQLVALSASSFLFVLSAGTAPGVAIFNETQASGTNGGTATAGSFVKRTLNTTIVNGITGCSIASSVITLPAGTYIVQGFGTVFSTVNNYRSRLQNTSDATTAIQGTNGFTQGTVDSSMGYAEVIGHFTIATSKNFELQTRVGATIANNGYGPSITIGDEVYSQIFITKVA